ncbi:hypothetical protein COU54_01735 [Candidatus Pacearchaeota archaeon CG10_big_fil_rev_8_21_14_0_10_31_24]|nr:MAG: hypothetical protein COU54_01735 [Candidatus Pacearchaeota archaeon CG10_big_fil_rev_8_21_14_0_10_31_24]
MEGEVGFANPVCIGDNLEVTLGKSEPYSVGGIVIRIDHKGFARDVYMDDKFKVNSSLFLQTDLPSKKLDLHHERNDPHF